VSHAERPPPNATWLLVVAYFSAAFLGGVAFTNQHMPASVGFGARPAWLLMGGIAGFVIAIFFMVLYYILEDFWG